MTFIVLIHKLLVQSLSHSATDWIDYQAVLNFIWKLHFSDSERVSEMVAN